MLESWRLNTNPLILAFEALMNVDEFIVIIVLTPVNKFSEKVDAVKLLAITVPVVTLIS